MPKIVTRQAAGQTFPAVATEDVETVLACGAQYGIVDQPDPSLVVASPDAGVGLEAWISAQRKVGRGIVLQMPDLSGVPLDRKPARSGLELFCQPDSKVIVQPALMSTNSLHAAMGFITGAGSAVLVEPEGGWIEGRGRISTALSWPMLLAVGAGVAVASWWVLGRD